MRKNYFPVVLIQAMLLNMHVCPAQKISSMKGLTTASFVTGQGNIRVYLPDDMRTGDLISGRIKAEAIGKNARQVEKNLEELKKYTLSFNHEKYSLNNADNPFRSLVQADQNFSCVLELLNASGEKINTLHIPVNQANSKPSPNTGCGIPSHALCGSPLRITGPFDGDYSNTNCSLNGNPLEILAESPRQCLLTMPEGAKGVGTMEVKESGQVSCAKQVSGVNMELSTGKLNLLKGESTYIDIRVTGLENLRDKAVLTVNNLNPGIVNMTGGNLQVIPIWPVADSAHGTFFKHLPAVSIHTGNFSVDINLDLPQAGIELTPSNQVPPGYTRKTCACSVSANVIKTGNTFKGIATGECKGAFGIGINTFEKCGVQSMSYEWTVVSGKENAEITGKNNMPSIELKPKNNGNYVVCETITVICIDGTNCTTTVCTDHTGTKVRPPEETKPLITPEITNVPTVPTVPKTPTITNSKACNLVIEELVSPKMDGGLKEASKGTKEIHRDDYIALGAEGRDYDQLRWNCNPVADCPDSKSEKIIPLNGRVRFEWNVDKGEGSFVKLGCLPDGVRIDEGDNVIFKPPFVPLPVKAGDTSKTTIVKLRVIDDNPTQPIDPTVERTVTIITRRYKLKPDLYTIEITSDKYTLPGPPITKEISGTCQATGPVWSMKNNLAKPQIELPGVPDNDKMVLGQWIVLKANDQRDPDKVNLQCVSAGQCPTSPYEKFYEDNVNWNWSSEGGGNFISDHIGRFVIFEAPKELAKGKDYVDVTFIVKVGNPDGMKIADVEPPVGKKTIRVYQPGVKLGHPDLDWLPGEDNSLELKSELMYKDGDWKPALAHMCRIHFFELMDVSAEKGICMNSPVPKDADVCRDLKLKNELKHEAFDDKKGSGKCDKKEMFLQARTQQPEKEYSIKIYSMDFGSYGFLRSFANINKGEKPVYMPIPAHIAHVLIHPQGRAKKNLYLDNRVTIPYDIDENHIADNGWKAGLVNVPDPADNKSDEDDKPIGDKQNGDGITNYEEYRGFKVSRNAGIEHIRTHPGVKDVFVRIEGGLNIELYENVSELNVHEITKEQYIGDDKRVINFNFNKATHLDFDQMGLHLVDKGSHSSLLGIAYSTSGQPTIPNYEIEIRVYNTSINRFVDRINLKVPPGNKLGLAATVNAVVAHELLHGNNVCHHGEGDPDIEKKADAINGLRSGDFDCVMRYSNVGTPLSKIPEIPGTILCTSAAGTGYNLNGLHFQDAAKNRGNCKGQIRITAVKGMPKSCGNR